MDRISERGGSEDKCEGEGCERAGNSANHNYSSWSGRRETVSTAYLCNRERRALAKGECPRLGRIDE
jgi:hypothetical protein